MKFVFQKFCFTTVFFFKYLLYFQATTEKCYKRLTMQRTTTCYLKFIFKVSLSLRVSVEIISVTESCLLQDTMGGVTQRGKKPTALSTA